ncbi:MAG TPA: Crp/Fnr family transcriptional regulator [Bryobacteraceae bacterium]|nr:Crp/Fnr family transcriptional regulator [Bryobacteraceae bacterium]
MQNESFDLKKFFNKVNGGRSIKEYVAGETIFHQEDPASAVFYVKQGQIKLAVVSPEGKEAVICILGEGDFFGEGCLIGQQVRVSTATAASDCVIMRIAKESFVKLLHDEPSFSELFLAHLLSRNIRYEEDLVDQLFNSSEKRLARVLLLLANFAKEGKSEKVMTKISQETLAQMIGTTRSRVSFFMNKFRRLGFVHYNGGLEVHSSLINVILHSSDFRNKKG